MTTLPLTNIFLILGIAFLIIAVLGQAKLFFLEINPGCFGRLLALFLGTGSLAFALSGGNFSVETIDLLRNYLTQAIQQSFVSVNELLNS